MQNRKIILLTALLFTGLLGRAQNSAVILNYIQTYKDIAIQEELRTGVPAAIKLAQGIHETTAGTSDLVVKSNNHFGIKCKATWTGQSVKHDDDLRNECFRKYGSAQDSYRDHSDFLKSSPRYASLFALDPTDYQSWAKGLKKAGYATNPKYPQVIIKLIEDYNLQDYTLIALGKLPAGTDPLASVEKNKKETLPVIPIVQTENVQKQEWTNAGEKITTETKQNYPTGEFRLNDTRVVFVKKGTSFLAIANDFNVPLARIFEFNEIPIKEIADRDQLLFLQRKRKTGANEFHIVKEGETLRDIAQLEALRLESLLGYNLLKENMQPATGERLYLRAHADVPPRLEEGKKMAASSTGKLNLQTCTVQPKETIYSIAKKYNVKIDDIVAWNELQGYNLKTGQQLKIYK
jgi:hypothetical protein